MRAWLLLLAVLATFQPIVQVASTEDISSKFITAILPMDKLTTTTRRTTAAVTATSSMETTTVANAFNPMIKTESLAFTSKVSSISSTTSPILVSSKTFLYENSVSDNSNLINNNHNSENDQSDRIKIEIKNIAMHTNIYNSAAATTTTSEHRTEQLDISKNNNNLINNTKNSSSTSSRRNSDKSEPKQTVQVSAINEKHEMAVKENTSLATTTTTTTKMEQHHHQHHHQKHSQHHHQLHPQHHHHHHHHHHKQHVAEQTNSKVAQSSSNIIQTVPALEFENSDKKISQQERPNESLPVKAISENEVEDDDVENEEEDLESEPADTYSNKEIISEKVKPDPTVLVEIENSLLSLFNMKRPPKIDRSKIVIPDAMKKLYAQIMGHEIDSVNLPKPGLLTKSANTVRSFTHKDSKIDDRFPHHHRFRLYFDIKSIPAEEKLKAAELQLTRDAISHAALNPRQANRTRYQVLVYDITRVGVRGKREPSYLLLDNKTVRLNSTEIVSLDVQPAISRWLAAPKNNFGLLVEVRTMRSLKPAPHHHVRLRRSVDESHEHWQHKQPLLFTYTDDGRHKSRSIRDVSTRSKRAGHRRSHRRKNADEVCRRHSLYVDFHDVGWSDWIVAPPGYDAYYCHGKCPFPLAEHLNSTNHAVVQTLVNNMNPEKVPKPCCVPTQLEGISMLYLNDERTVVVKNYQDMAVVGCGCR